MVDVEFIKLRARDGWSIREISRLPEDMLWATTLVAKRLGRCDQQMPS